MKQILLLFALTVLSASLRAQYSDLKEYGLTGNIKAINQSVYVDLVSRDRKAKPIDINELVKPVYRKILHFNSSGQMDTVRFLDYDFGNGASDSLMNNMLVTDFKNGIKSGGKNYDFHNRPGHQFKVEWIEDRIYKETVTDSTGTKVYETTSWLDAEFRDSVGQTLGYDKGVLIVDEKYSNQLDASKRLVRVDYIDGVNKSKRSETIEYLEFDKQGNWTKSVVRDADTGKFIKMNTRIIEYY